MAQQEAGRRRTSIIATMNNPQFMPGAGFFDAAAGEVQGMLDGTRITTRRTLLESLVSGLELDKPGKTQADLVAEGLDKLQLS